MEQKLCMSRIRNQKESLNNGNHRIYHFCLHTTASVPYIYKAEDKMKTNKGDSTFNILV
jgi:hypothetical protein